MSLHLRLSFHFLQSTDPTSPTHQYFESDAVRNVFVNQIVDRANNNFAGFNGNYAEERYKREQVPLWIVQELYANHPTINNREDMLDNWEGVGGAAEWLESSGLYDSELPDFDTKIRLSIGENGNDRIFTHSVSNNNLCSASSISSVLPNHPDVDNDVLENTINVFVTACVSTQCGQAVFPSHSNYNANDAFAQLTVGTQITSTNLWAIEQATGNCLSHEIGHILNLCHTHSNAGTFNDTQQQSTHCDYLGDIFDALAPDLPNDRCWMDVHEQVSPTDSIACNGTTTDKYTNNLMGYTKYNCYISPLQAGIMHRTLSMTGRSKCLKDCSYNESNPLIIDSDATIDFDFRIYRDIVIKQGATLILSCTLRMPKDAKIIVERGAKFIIDGGYITNACEGERWGGIEVWGNNTKDHANIDNGSIIFNQVADDPGILHISNNSVIENGPNGTIRNFREGFSMDYSGGIIIAEDSEFYNNIRTAAFLAYPFSDASRFINCRFEVNELFEEVQDQVTIWSSEGITFENCDFEVTWSDTERTSYYNSLINSGTLNLVGSTPKGIYTEDASYTVNNCKFKNLTTAIHSNNVVTDNRNIEVIGDNIDDTPEFDGCVYGILAENISSVKVNACEFNPNLSSLPTNATFESYSVALRGLTADSEIHNNIFTNSDNSEHCFAIHLEDTKTNIADISENKIVDFRNGLDFHNENLYSRFSCNDLTTSDYDVHLYGGTSSGKLPNQGGTFVTAGNLFSDIVCGSGPSGHEHIRTFNSEPFYYFHSNGVRRNPNCSTPNWGNAYGGNTENINCSFYDGGGGGGTPVTGGFGGPKSLDTAPCKSRNCFEAQIDIKNEVMQDLAVGNATALYNALNFSANNLTTYKQLMEASPYLSDEVMDAILESNMSDFRKGVILYKNAPLSDALMVKAYDEVPQSIYFRLYWVKQTVDESKRKIAEKILAAKKMKIAKSLNYLLSNARQKNDYTEGIELLSLEGSNNSAKRIVGWMRSFEEVNDLASELEKVAISDEMNEFYMLQTMLNKYEIGLSTGAGSTEEALSETEITLLESIVNEGSSENKWFACALLARISGDYCNLHTHLGGEETAGKMGETNLIVPEPSGINSFLNLYPNPTQGELSLELWGISNEDNVRIEVSDISGKLIQVERIVNELSVLTLNNSLSQGIYIANIYLNDISIHNEKIVLVR